MLQLKNYLPPSYAIQSTELHFSIFTQHTIVLNRSYYKKMSPRQENLFLNGEDIELSKILLNGQSLKSDIDYKVTTEGLTLFHPPDSFLLEIETTLYPSKNTSLEGLYFSKNILCTQCEAEGFRKITYFLDRPDVMTQFLVSIEADENQYPVLLSNGSRLHTEKRPQQRHRTWWKDPFKKPCYLFALVAGDLGCLKDEYTTVSGRKVELEIYATHGLQESCKHAMTSLKHAMLWDEKVYGLEYDLNNYMIVAIDDFNAGAMENKGLNIFNSKLILADPRSATDDDFKSIESVVAHEYFHNWTGNRVTLRDWFQLSLKEGLTVFRDQEFSSDQLDRGLQRIEDVVSLRSTQFPEDAGPNSHPVRPESCLSVDNFFTATIYSKGAELIRMMQTIVGKKGFNKGLKSYLQKYDGQAVTTEDFSEVIASSNQVDFSQFNLWYSCKGTPYLHVTEALDPIQKTYTLTLEQSNVAGVLSIPLLIEVILKKSQKNCTLQDLQLALKNCTKTKILANSDDLIVLFMQDPKITLEWRDLDEKPFVSLLRQFSAPIILKWNREYKDWIEALENETDSFNRWEAGQKLHELALLNLYKNQSLSDMAMLSSAWSTVLNNTSLDPGLKGLMLNLPTTAACMPQLDYFEGRQWHSSCLQYRKIMAQDLSTDLKKQYDWLSLELTSTNQNNNYEPKLLKLRSLQQSCLLLLSLQPFVDWDFYWQKLLTTQNMTEEISLLHVFIYSENIYQEKALNLFYEKWKNYDLVVNKWFALQASRTDKHSLDRVKELLFHPRYEGTNPNKIYSLLRTFGQNTAVFYDAQNSEAFQFYLEKISEIDRLNPQVAARLCAAFNFTYKLMPEHKSKILQTIKHFLNNQQLSKNTKELLQTY